MLVSGLWACAGVLSECRERVEEWV